MNDGFSISTLDVDANFSFVDELEKLGFERIDDPKKDYPTEYKGIMYDYESDSYANVHIERIEKNFRGRFSKYIHIYKSVNGNGSCVYVGLQPQSYIVYRMLMANLFPSESYIKHYEEETLGKEYIQAFGDDFNMQYALEKLGYVTQDKSQECLSTKGNIAIYYAVPALLDDSGRPVACHIERDGKVLYDGKMPSNIVGLMQLLQELQIE